MSVDPAVRSVRVAVALCDRFADLLKGPASVSARKQSGALLGVSGNEGEMSLRIGEAQQLYPEIWRHLDDARAAFSARGIDVSGYDVIRAAEGQALGADVDVANSRRGYGQYAIEEHVKSANFNRAGLARAREAVDSFMRVTPQIDWAAIARAEADDPAAAAFGRAARTRRWLLLGMLLLVIASPFLYVIHLRNQEKDDRATRAEAYDPGHAPVERPQISDRDRAELASMVSQLRGTLSAARKSWPAAVTPGALAAVVASSRPCVLPYQAPPSPAADRFIRDGNGDALGASTFGSYVASEPIRDDQLAAMAAIVDAVDARLTAHRATGADRDRLARIEPYVVFLIVDHDVLPAITAISPKVSYTPGKVTGRAFVYAVQSGQIVCTGKIDAHNTPSDTSTYLDALPTTRQREAVGDTLHRELEIRIRQALASELRATAP